jgi:enoyl-CoA hydratase/carnithine racemase
MTNHPTMTPPATGAGAGAPLVARANHEGICTLTLNDPSSRNSLSEEMLALLAATFDGIAADPSVRVVLLQAEGPVFCSGHHLKQMTAHRADADRGRAYFADMMARCAAVMGRITRLPQPVIAVVEGVATAAGCQLVATCDLAIADARATFSTPGVHIGLFCSTPMVALSRNVSAKHAMEMLLTGESVSAEDAYRFGLVNRVTAQGDARRVGRVMADTIAAKSTLTVKTGKRAFYDQRTMSLDEAYAAMGQVMVENMLARDAEEGIGAFIDKREPRWEDR